LLLATTGRGWSCFLMYLRWLGKRVDRDRIHVFFVALIKLCTSLLFFFASTQARDIFYTAAKTRWGWYGDRRRAIVYQSRSKITRKRKCSTVRYFGWVTFDLHIFQFDFLRKISMCSVSTSWFIPFVEMLIEWSHFMILKMHFGTF
jgi:hypothetical protein